MVRYIFINIGVELFYTAIFMTYARWLISFNIFIRGSFPELKKNILKTPKIIINCYCTRIKRKNN